MSTYFPAGGEHHETGAWWKILHDAIDAGADLDALRLVHIAGIGNLEETACARIEQALDEQAACVRYDETSMLIIEPGVTDEEVVKAVQTVFDVTRERLKLWRVIRAHREGLDFEPIGHDSAPPPPPPPPSTPPSTPPPPPSTPESRHRIVLTDAEFHYFPVWDTAAHEIFCYVCENFWDTGDGERVQEDALAEFFTKTRHVFALDREALHKAVAQARDFLDRYLVTNILIPVHYSTVADPDLFSAYTDACAQDVWSVVDNIFFEITKVPMDADQGVLAAAVEILQSYGRDVLLRLESEYDDFDHLPRLEVHSIGLDYHYDRRDEGEMQVELEAFAAAARAQGYRHHVHSLKTMDLCITAIRGGFRYISSEVIAPPLDFLDPEEVAAHSPDVLRDLFKSAL